MDLIYEGITTMSQLVANDGGGLMVRMDLIYEGITTQRPGQVFFYPYYVRMDLIYEGITTGDNLVIILVHLGQNGPDLRRDYDDLN